MVNRERLAETFKFLVEIDSVSREEGAMAGEIRKTLDLMGAETFVDSAGDKNGGQRQPYCQITRECPGAHAPA